MRYLLDTNAVSTWVRRSSQPLIERIRASIPEALAVSTVTVYEIEYGFEKKPEVRASLGAATEAFLSVVSVIPFDAEIAREAGRIRQEVRVQTIGPYDLLIAATARRYGLTLVTRNFEEISRVPGLAIENWELPFTSTAPRP